jgi:hypothetical protein
MNPGANERLRIWDYHRERAMAAFAACRDTDGLMLVLANLRDPIAQPLIEALSLKSPEIAALANVIERLNATPTALMLVPIEAVAIVTGPQASAALKSPTPPGFVPVAVMAEGGTTIIYAPTGSMVVGEA